MCSLSSLSRAITFPLTHKVSHICIFSNMSNKKLVELFAGFFRNGFSWKTKIGVYFAVIGSDCFFPRFQAFQVKGWIQIKLCARKKPRPPDAPRSGASCLQSTVLLSVRIIGSFELTLCSRCFQVLSFRYPSSFHVH